MLKKYAIEKGDLVITEDDAASVWVFIDPGADERRTLIDELRINEYDVSSALDPDEVPRLIVEDDYTAIIWNHPCSTTSGGHSLFHVATAGLFLMPNRLIVIFPDEYRLFDRRSRLKLQAPIDVVLSYLYQTIQHYMGHLKVIRMVASEMQSKISTTMQTELLVQLFGISEGLVYYLNAITSNHTVLERLRHYCDRREDLREKLDTLDDIVVENQQCTKQAEIYSQVLAGLIEARGTLINNNMNALIKRLTILNVIFLPLNLIAGIGGMSEFSMMTQGTDWRISYSVFLAIMGVLGWGFAFILSRMGVAGANGVKHLRKRR